MNSFFLRTLALLAMITDHVGLALFPRVGLFRCVGRIAFPLYCFLLVQGYLHTHDKRAYTLRLALLAFVSEIPFNALIFGHAFSPVEMNPVFSLLLSLLALRLLEDYGDQPALTLFALLAVFLASMLLGVSFGWLGVALCLWLFKTNGRPASQALSVVVLSCVYTLSLHLSGVATSWVLVSLCAVFAAVPILLYNNRPGVRAAPLSFLFYAAYPLHMIALIALRAMRIIPPYIFG